jgi:hypothetical protein
MKFGGRTIRSLVDAEDPRQFAPWVRALRNRNGVYLIVQDDQAHYVGVSYSGKLYGTLTRHVQNWSRRGSQAYTGPVFDRFAILVAVEIIDDPQEAQRRERDWIHRFSPLLNRQELPFETKRMRATDVGDAYEGEVIESEADAIAHLTDRAVIEDDMDAAAFFDSLIGA